MTDAERNEKFMSYFNEYEKEKTDLYDYVGLIKKLLKSQGKHITRENLAKLIVLLVKSAIPIIYKKSKCSYRTLFRLNRLNKNIVLNFIADNYPKMMSWFLENMHRFDFNLEKKSSYKRHWEELLKTMPYLETTKEYNPQEIENKLYICEKKDSFDSFFSIDEDNLFDEDETDFFFNENLENLNFVE